MSRSVLAIIAVALSIAAGSARAEGQSVGPFTIQQMKVDAGNVGLMFTTTYTESQCGLGTVSHVMLRPSEPAFMPMYAAVLNALGSGKRVRFWIEGCSSATQSFWGTRWPLVRSVDIVAAP